MKYTSYFTDHESDGAQLSEFLASLLENNGSPVLIYQEIDGRPINSYIPLRQADLMPYLRDMVTEARFIVIGVLGEILLVPIAKNEVVAIHRGDSAESHGFGVEQRNANDTYEEGDWFEYLQPEISEINSTS